MFEDEYDMQMELWTNSACLGYVISAMRNLDYDPGQISEIVMELKELFDWMTIDGAQEAYNDSGVE